MTTRKTKTKGHSGKAGKVQGFAIRTLADGRTKYHWTPSPRLRAAGWSSLDLGFDEREALARAYDRNKEIEEWQAGMQQDGAAKIRRPRKWTFRELWEAYEASAQFAGLAPKTKVEYRSKANWLLAAMASGGAPGGMFVSNITEEICQTMRDKMIGRVGAATIAMRLRVLRIILAHAVKPLHILKENPAKELGAPAPPPRRKRITEETVELLAGHALAMGLPSVALGITLGFYSFQRQGDLVAASRTTLHRMHNMAPADRAVLQNADGEVWGLRILQQKTGQWVDAMLPPDIADELRRNLAERDREAEGPLPIDAPLIASPNAPHKRYDQRIFRRDVEKVMNGLREKAEQQGNGWLVDQLAGLQYRDLRRSGMCWMRDLGVQAAHIATQSGHKIGYTQAILDTYMPGDQRATAAGMAHALRARAERQSEADQTRQNI